MITKYTEYIKESRSSSKKHREYIHSLIVKEFYILEELVKENDLSKIDEFIRKIFNDNNFTNTDRESILTMNRNYEITDIVFNRLLKILLKNKSDNDYIIKYIFIENAWYYDKDLKYTKDNINMLIELIDINRQNKRIFSSIINYFLLYPESKKVLRKILSIKKDFITLETLENNVEKDRHYYSKIISFYKDDNEKLKKFLDDVDLNDFNIVKKIYITLDINNNEIVNYFLNKVEITTSEKMNDFIKYILDVSHSGSYEFVVERLEKLLNYYEVTPTLKKVEILQLIKIFDEDKIEQINKLLNVEKLTFLQYYKLNKTQYRLNNEKSIKFLTDLFDILKNVNPTKIWSYVKNLYIDSHKEDYVIILNYLEKYDLLKYCPTEAIIMTFYCDNLNLITKIKELINKYFNITNHYQILKFLLFGIKNMSRFDFTSAYYCQIAKLKQNGRVYNSNTNYENYKEFIDWYCLLLIDKLDLKHDVNYYQAIKELISDKKLLNNIWNHLDSAKNFDLL